MKPKTPKNSPRPRPGSLARIEKKLGIIIARQAHQATLANQEKIMSDNATAAAALAQARADIKQEIADLGTQMDSNFQKLLDALKASGGMSAADVQTAADDLQTDITALKGIGTRDTAA